jgi:hypothetical protein
MKRTAKKKSSATIPASEAQARPQSSARSLPWLSLSLGVVLCGITYQIWIMAPGTQPLALLFSALCLGLAWSARPSGGKH